MMPPRNALSLVDEMLDQDDPVTNAIRRTSTPWPAMAMSG
jgi:hypothetical protein